MTHHEQHHHHHEHPKDKPSQTAAALRQWLKSISKQGGAQ